MLPFLLLGIFCHLSCFFSSSLFLSVAEENCLLGHRLHRMAPNIPCLEIVLVLGTDLVFRDFSSLGGCSGVWGPFLSLRTVTVLGDCSGVWGLFHCDSLTVIITGLTLKGLKVLFITP